MNKKLRVLHRHPDAASVFGACSRNPSGPAVTLAREFGAKPAEIRTFLAGTLGADRTRELTDQMRAAGVPL